MKTRDALKALSKGEKTSGGIQEPRLQERAAKYKAQYDARDAQIVARKNRDTVVAPVLEVLRRKIATAASEQDNATPVAMRFYVFTAMKSAAEQHPQDRGISQAVHILGSLWQKDPMGSLTLGQVTEIRNRIKDTNPRSKVAKVLDTVVSRVGYSTLPVAKLARLANQVETQEDFDTLIKAAGFDGDRPEHIKARTLVRELVAMRGGSPLESETSIDERTAFERVTDRVAREAQIMPQNEPALEPSVPGESLGMDEVAPGDEHLMPDEMGGDLDVDVAPGNEAEEVEEIIPMIEEVDQIVEDNMPPAAEPYVEEELAEGGALPGTAEWGFAEAEEGHSAPPPSPEWQSEELEEHGIGGGDEMGGMGGEMGELPLDIAAPMTEEPGMGGPAEHGLSGKLAAKRAAIQDAMGTKKAQHEPSDINLPKATFGHDMNRQKQMKQLQQAYKSRQLPAAEYLKQMRLLEDMSRVKSHMPGSKPLDASSFEAPAAAGMDAKVAEGMKAPKPPADGQYGGRRNNDAPDRGKDGGKELTKDESIGVGDAKKAFTMSAADIEAALIDRGEEIKYGSAALRINESDEIEFWHKGAGQACALVDIDVAISDFLKAAATDHIAAQPKGLYQMVDLVPVPCGKCGSAQLFEFTASKGDVYACGDCGHRTKAALVAEMVRHGQLGKQFAITVEVPSHISFDPQVKRMFEQRLTAAVNNTHQGNLYQRSPSEWEIVVSSEEAVNKLQRVLAQLGIEESNAVRRAQFDAGSIAAPGSADMPVAPEVTPQGAAAPKAAPQGGPSEAPAPGASAPGTIGPDDMAAAFRHYKAMELPFPEAMAQFAKDYKEKIEAGWQSPQMDVELIDIARQLYSSSGPTSSGPSAQQVMQAKVAWNLAKKSFQNPKVNRQQPDAVSVKSFPGTSNSDEKDPGRFQAPKPKANGKQPGAGSQSGTKAPPKDMGKTNEDKHPSGLDAPKPPADGHVKGKAGDQPGTKAVPNKELGKDSDHNGKEVPMPGKFGPRPKVGSKAASKSKPSASKPSKSSSK
jgi:hypothetical protein